MAKKELSISISKSEPTSETSWWHILENSLPVRQLARCYSDILEMPISPRRTLHFLHAQLSILMLLLFGGGSIFMLLLLAAWTCLALANCSKSKERI